MVHHSFNENRKAILYRPAHMALEKDGFWLLTVACLLWTSRLHCRISHAYEFEPNMLDHVII